MFCNPLQSNWYVYLASQTWYRRILYINQYFIHSLTKKLKEKSRFLVRAVLWFTEFFLNFLSFFFFFFSIPHIFLFMFYVLSSFTCQNHENALCLFSNVYFSLNCIWNSTSFNIIILFCCWLWPSSILNMAFGWYSIEQNCNRFFQSWFSG